MATNDERMADDQYEAQNDEMQEVNANELTDGGYTTGNRPGESNEIPVVSDAAAQKELDDNAIPSNSDAQLEEDDKMAIDQNNIMDSRTRGAKPSGSLSEGPDEDDLPAAVNQEGDGTSSTA